MKNYSKTMGLVLIVIAGFFYSCKKEEVPALTTAEVTNITGTSATSGGTVTDGNPVMIVERGICWSKVNPPTTNDGRTIEPGGSVSFTSEMTDLEGATTYYVRAYATNPAGTGYGEVVSFETLGQPPAALTQVATNVNTTSAALNGVVLANYLSTTVTFEYGLTSNYGQTATAAQSPVAGNSLTDVNTEITGLAEGTTYHFRLKTVNSLGTTYGNDMTFKTLGDLPVAVTLAACCLSANGGRLNGTVNASWLSTVVTFEYGLTTDYGSLVTAYQSPVTGNSIVNVYSGVAGLNPATTYHFRIKAVNSLGTTYGEDKEFTTLN